MFRRWWDRGPVYPPWGVDPMPELTARELKILTRPKLSPWVGVVLMLWVAFLQLAPVAPGRKLLAWIVDALVWGAGLAWFVVAIRWQSEREKVLQSLRGSMRETSGQVKGAR